MVGKCAMVERLQSRLKSLMLKSCKKFNRLYSSLSKVKTEFTDAMGGQQVSFHGISFLTPTRHLSSDAVEVDTGQLTFF